MLHSVPKPLDKAFFPFGIFVTTFYWFTFEFANQSARNARNGDFTFYIRSLKISTLPSSLLAFYCGNQKVLKKLLNSCQNNQSRRHYTFNLSCANFLQRQEAFFQANIIESSFSKDDYHQSGTMVSQWFLPLFLLVFTGNSVLKLEISLSKNRKKLTWIDTKNNGQSFINSDMSWVLLGVLLQNINLTNEYV